MVKVTSRKIHDLSFLKENNENLFRDFKFLLLNKHRFYVTSLIIPQPKSYSQFGISLTKNVLNQ